MGKKEQRITFLMFVSDIYRAFSCKVKVNSALDVRNDPGARID